MCRQPAIFAPFKGLVGPYFFRIIMRPGISFSAKFISFLPHSARLISARKMQIFGYQLQTLYSELQGLCPNQLATGIPSKLVNGSGKKL
jgi:hypothetical protein